MTMSLKSLVGSTRHSGRRSENAGRQPGYTAAQLVAAKAAWDAGEPVNAVRAILGVQTDGGVYAVRKKEKWTPRTKAQRLESLRQRHARAAAGLQPDGTPPAPAPSVHLTPRRRCVCGGITTQDPCEHCGGAWNNA